MATQTQANPLLDDYEGMAITVDVLGIDGVSPIGEDNFGATQITRVLNPAARLP